MQRNSLLMNEEPLDALCHHFNVAPKMYSTSSTSSSLAEAFDMPVLRDAHMPTHVLAVSQPDSDPANPILMLPVDTSLYEDGFRVELSLPQTAPGTASPIPHTPEHSKTPMVSLPTVPITVPHASSMPLLLLFGLGLENQPNLLAWRLLPPQVIEEFPNAAAMSQIMSQLRDDQFERHFRYNQGLWKNILALGLRSTRLVELVQTAWNVTAEARKIRQREQQRR